MFQIDANGNRNEYIQLQKSWKESAKCQTFADNTYQVSLKLLNVPFNFAFTSIDNTKIGHI